MNMEKDILLNMDEETDSLFGDDADFLLDDETESEESAGTWRVMIVDDDQAVHDATKYSLYDFSFMEKSIEWIDAYSAKEAMLLAEHDKDIALMFLDVVMESDSAGLDYIRWFREKNINPSTRVILRTGQPGSAPAKEVIMNYDLHDYKTKTELTSDKLFTTTVAALRAYHDMSRLESTKEGLENIVAATSNIFKIQSMYGYAKAVLQQIETVLDIRSSGIVCVQKRKGKNWEFLARSGDIINDDEEILAILESCNGTSLEHIEKNCMVKVLSEGNDEVMYAIYVEPLDSLTDIQTRMLLMFCNNVSVGISNIKLYNSLLNSHKITVMSLAQVTESRDQDTGEHVFRIAHITEKLAQELLKRGIYKELINDKFCAEIGLSSTLHDVGKVAVSDKILLKPGRLTDPEFEKMKEHCEAGAYILESAMKNSGERVNYLEIGERIARSHHEKWDGSGYPQGLVGQEIPVEARITALADVFDALTHRRCYKDAFTLMAAQDIIREGLGSHFDPEIGNVFLDMLDKGQIVIEP